jgi:hypothetical protein
MKVKHAQAEETVRSHRVVHSHCVVVYICFQREKINKNETQPSLSPKRPLCPWGKSQEKERKKEPTQKPGINPKRI